MRIILSRKGFDSTAGGCPSPIFPDGQMLSLPIPSPEAPIGYDDIPGYKNGAMGELVRDLAGLPGGTRAHLDPDLRPESLRRAPGWQALFGQVDNSQSHLEKQGVRPGDLFLFFGLYREVTRSPAGTWKYLPGSRPKHVLFGWLQAERVVPVAQWPRRESWAHYHPHFTLRVNAKNVLYVGTRTLNLPGRTADPLPGYGTFPRFSPRLQLSCPNAGLRSLWRLPAWFHPEGRSSHLSYHGGLEKWQRNPGGRTVTLSTVGRGQEFVLDTAHYPEALDWALHLIRGKGPLLPPPRRSLWERFKDVLTFS